MNKSVSLMLSVLVVGAALEPAANAVTLSVIPEATSANVGSTFSVDVVASGLLDGAAPSIGTYDLDLNYNSSVLSFANVSFGTGLDVLGLGSIQAPDPSTPGKVNVFELSLDSEADLNQLQHDAFKLFTLTFNAAAVGSSALQLTISALGDAAGNSLDATLQNGSAAVTPVPLPPTLVLFLSGLLGLALIHTRRPAGRPSIPGLVA